jgi:hypothetical protein
MATFELLSDWVLRKQCGCPAGVATVQHHATEDEAWKGFFDSWKGIAKALQAGMRLEMMPHSRYRTEVMPFLTNGRCEHEKEAL